MVPDSTPQRSPLFILWLLGSLSVVSPFNIDMYLTAFPKVASDFGVPTSAVSLTLSGYFIGMAGGQLFYGPLLDRFGRKPPLIAGLLLFLAASLGCAASTSIDMLVAMRFLQGLGGCAAQVASLAMVHDFFPPRQSARIRSLLFLFIAVSPLAAPSVGGFVVSLWGWRAVFVTLFVVVGLILALVWLLLPEGHKPDRGVSLRVGPILREYAVIFRHPAFATYALAGALSFSGLFAYVAGSPIVFMDNFHLSPGAYSTVFALLAAGLIGASQVNILLLRTFSSRSLFAAMLALQAVASVSFAFGIWGGWIGLYGTIALFFICLSCLGIINPNGAAVALSPFGRNAGSAAALLGFIQLGIGAVISSGISMGRSSGSVTVIGIFAVTSVLAGIVLLLGFRSARAALAARDAEEV
jgi:DHA1 family bicyclomycin/chloramphenicol resistance-like MFS transporter